MGFIYIYNVTNFKACCHVIQLTFHLILCMLCGVIITENYWGK
jgi:hypothetical protein